MVEECMVCHEPTGKAGRDEDSLYTPNGVGPWCEQCFDDAWPIMVPNPDLLALAKLGAWAVDHDEIDNGDRFVSGVTDMSYGVTNEMRSLVTRLLAPDGAASEGVTDA